METITNMDKKEENDSFYDLCRKIPPFLGMDIFKFLIPNSKEITFKNPKWNIPPYNRRYEAAFIGEKLVQNDEKRYIGSRLYLSRISKKNGKHRYYITKENAEIECYGCRKKCCSGKRCRRNSIIPHYIYSSNYVGKDINIALTQLFLLTKTNNTSF